MRAAELVALSASFALAIVAIATALVYARRASRARPAPGPHTPQALLADHRAWLASAVTAWHAREPLPVLDVAHEAHDTSPTPPPVDESPAAQLRAAAPGLARIALASLAICSVVAVAVGGVAAAAVLLIAPLAPLGAALRELLRPPPPLAARTRADGLEITGEARSELIPLSELDLFTWSLTRVQLGRRHLADRLAVSWQRPGQAEPTVLQRTLVPGTPQCPGELFAVALATERTLAERTLSADDEAIALPIGGEGGGRLMWHRNKVVLQRNNEATVVPYEGAEVFVERRPGQGLVFVAQAAGAAQRIELPWARIGLPILAEEAWRACLGPFRTAVSARRASGETPTTPSQDR